jgi:uncharacterized protein YcbX
MVGTVSRLWRYPVKSMLGEQCPQLQVEPRGIAGDRLYALRDAEGKFGSGKNGRRFRQIDGMFGLRARYRDGLPEISLPDGGSLRADDARVDVILSKVLGLDVRLERDAGATHFDSGPVHLVSTRALDWLRSRLPESKVDERRFRPNIVVDTEDDEQSWPGRVLHIGQARLRVLAPTERCRMTTLPQDDLPSDPRILTCIGRDAQLRFGVYAEVLGPGEIRVGDAVDVLAA